MYGLLRKLVQIRLASFFTVHPLVSHVSEAVRICGKGFAANKELTIRASVQVAIEKLNLSSHSHIVTSSDGTFDTAKCRSHGGSYTGVDQMGLFWSMTAADTDSLDRMQFTDASLKMTYNFQVYDGFLNEFDQSGCINECSITRYLIDDKVERINVKEGRLRGTLFKQSGEEGPLPAVVVVQGGVKNKRIGEDVAAYLASNGFVALALAFFNVDDLPNTYDTVDLTYFEEAVNWLQEVDGVSGKIGMYGSSKGGEIAFSMMSQLIPLDAVVWAVSTVVSTGSKTVYKDTLVCDIAEVKWENVEHLPGDLVGVRDMTGDPREQPSCIQPFYRSPADLMMIGSEDDQILDSCLHCDVAEDLMRATGKRNFTIRKFKHLGHLVDLPHTPVCNVDFHPMIPRPKKIYFGGKNKQKHAKEQIKFWHNVVDFYKKKLF